MFRKVRDLFVTGGTFNHTVITNNTYHGTGGGGPRDKLLEHASPNAIHDSKELESQGICMENTREAVLKLLSDYLLATTLDSPGLLWLNGAAGVGKSAVARSLAHIASESATLVGSFFFFSSDATRNTLDTLIPTLAVQICRRFPKARSYVERAIDDDPLIFTKGTSAQADALVVGPLVQALRAAYPRPSTPLSILVDGLDECFDSGKQAEAVHILLAVIAKVHTATGIRLKVVLFSRPERWIKDRMAQYERVGQVMTVALEGDLSPRSDIKLYYLAHFVKIQEDHPGGPFLEPDWPSPQQMEQLVDITDNHFAFAHTMRIFAANPNEDPRQQLEIILGIAKPTRGSPHTHIDKLFATIFSRVPPHLLPKTLRIIGAILIPSEYALFPNPLLLELLFSLKRGELQQMFFHLESLFDMRNRTSNWIRVHHKTLADFLFTPSRSEEYGLSINKGDVYEDIRQTIRSVLLRQEAPEREGLTALVQFLKRLSTSSDETSPSDQTSDTSSITLSDTRKGPNGLTTSTVTCRPWAKIVWGAYSTKPIIRSLGLSFSQHQLQVISTEDDIEKALSAYNHSAFGRIALVFSLCAFWQTYDEHFQLFHQALLRHAIQSQPGLQELDKTIGWNLIGSNPNYLAEAIICLQSRPYSYLLNFWTQVARDALDPNWVVSRLGMLHSWHKSGHRLTDNPWEHAVWSEVVEVASESQLQCSRCSEVLELCKADVLERCLEEIKPDSALYQDIFEHVQVRTSLWNHWSLFFRWTGAIKDSEELIASDPYLTRIVNLIRKQSIALDQTCVERMTCLVLDGWDEHSAFQMGCLPYSRANIPFTPSDEHAARVSKQRAAWAENLELPEVVYTYPDSELH